jgi:hypothetical protein
MSMHTVSSTAIRRAASGPRPFFTETHRGLSVCLAVLLLMAFGTAIGGAAGGSIVILWQHTGVEGFLQGLRASGGGS